MADLIAIPFPVSTTDVISVYSPNDGGMKNIRLYVACCPAGYVVISANGYNVATYYNNNTNPTCAGNTGLSYSATILCAKVCN